MRISCDVRTVKRALPRVTTALGSATGLQLPSPPGAWVAAFGAVVGVAVAVAEDAVLGVAAGVVFGAVAEAAFGVKAGVAVAAPAAAAFAGGAGFAASGACAAKPRPQPIKIMIAARKRIEIRTLGSLICSTGKAITARWLAELHDGVISIAGFCRAATSRRLHPGVCGRPRGAQVGCASQEIR